MDPIFSIVIPCYNHGSFLRGAIESVQAVTSVSYEIIIVDDGSTEQSTREELAKLTSEGYNVIIQENAGPGAARNNGIRASKGKYILPLDADDRIRPEYIVEAYKVLTANEDIDVVYANYKYYGDANGVIKYEPFSLQRLVLYNSIGSCVIFRKTAWEKVKGYDERFKLGFSWEDWDLWINFAYTGCKFQHLDIIGYDYFYHNNSRERMFLKHRHRVNQTIGDIEAKYPGFYAPGVVHDYLVDQVKKSPVGMMIKIIAATYFPEFYRKQLKKGKIRKYLF